jgi:hypothetical protein
MLMKHNTLDVSWARKDMPKCVDILAWATW